MKKTFIAAVVLALTTSCFAAVSDSAGIMLPILDVGVGARACALSGAFTAGADDASAVFWNPAGLADLKAAEIALTYDAWMMDSFYSHVLAALPLGPGTLGADIIYVNGGSFPDVDSSGIPLTTSTNASSMGGLLSYGMKITGGLSAGLTAKFLLQSAGTISNTGMGVDAGIIYDLGMARIGVNARNIGAAGNYSMPISINGGVEITPLRSEQHVLSIELDGKYLLKDAPSIIGGVEYVYSKMFSVRAGYNYRIGTDSLGGLSGIAAGAGFNINNIRLDYAFVPYGELGTAHRATLSYQFGQAKPPAAPITKTGIAEKVEAAIKEADKFTKEGNLAKAAATLRAAVIDAPQNADLWKKLGMVYYKDRKKANAIKAFEMYIKLNPSDSSIKSWLDKYKK